MKLWMIVLLAAVAQEQPRYSQFGQHTERGGTRIAYWDGEKEQGAGEAAIDYGRPAWKPEYDEQLDAMTSDKIWRLGENFWTSLDTNIPLKIGGVDVPVGYYYLVIKRTAGGSHSSLTFVDPVEARTKLLDFHEVGTRPAEVPVRFEAPLTFVPRDTVQDPPAIELTEESLVILWGSFALSVPVDVAPC